MSCITGFVAAVPADNKEKFRKHAEEASKIFIDYGAIDVVECWGDDIPEGEVTSFAKAVKKEDNETVVFSWVIWPTKELRDSAFQKMMEDEVTMEVMGEMPFDGKRVIFGGFEIIHRRSAT